MATPDVNYELLLASKSPRRRELIGKLGYPTRFVDIDADETLHHTVPAAEVAQTIAQAKSEAYAGPLQPHQILVAADTVVVMHGDVLGKPHDRNEARTMLQRLSGKAHHVYTGVCLRSNWGRRLFTEHSVVHLCPLSDDVIEYYLSMGTYADKAGSYGIQDWIGYVAVQRIEGCYYNVMGLPMAHLYDELTSLIGSQQ